MRLTNLTIESVAYWLIRQRWYAAAGIIIALFTSKYYLKITIWSLPVYIIVLTLVVLNLFSYFYLRYLHLSGTQKALKSVKKIINFQITTDLIVLTVLLHFTGGVENPFIIYYIFHMIIGSVVLTSKENFIQTTGALFLIGSLAFLEYFKILPHYPLTGFISSNMYNNVVYLIFTGLIFISTSYFVIYMTSLIVKELKKHEEATLLANIELHEKDKIKDEYVMRITHDIKGHITAIQSCISVLDQKYTGPLNEIQEDFVNRAANRINVLKLFISDLLNLTKRRLGHNQEKINFNIGTSIDEVVKMAENYAQEKNITITKFVNLSENEINGEKSSIEEVLSNIIINAIKYSPENTIVSIAAKNQPGEVLIEVSDQGFGIPENELSLIFNEFYRASNVSNIIKDGTGLGLSISKHIVESHGGRIWAVSSTGIGTTFSFTLKQ
jgi:signal transduction histidine kinase